MSIEGKSINRVREIFGLGPLKKMDSDELDPDGDLTLAEYTRNHIYRKVGSEYVVIERQSTHVDSTKVVMGVDLAVGSDQCVAALIETDEQGKHKVLNHWPHVPPLTGHTPPVPGVAEGKVCDACDGEGEVYADDAKPWEGDHRTKVCPSCNGTGGTDPKAVEAARKFSRQYAKALGVD